MPLSVPAGIPPSPPTAPHPTLCKAWPGALGLLPSFDLTASDRGMKVSEDDYGMKVPITAVQRYVLADRPHPGGQAAGAPTLHPNSHRNHPPAFLRQTTVTRSHGVAQGTWCRVGRPGRSDIRATRREAGGPQGGWKGGVGEKPAGLWGDGG